jgi:hypothetical protein
MFQFGNSEDQVISFCTNLSKLLNRETKKQNCLEIISPPSSGKNWFLDPLLIFMTSKGQISNAKKGNNFPLDNCFNKRVLFFNEPRLEPTFYETLLMLFAGDPMSEQAKFRSVCEIIRTPVIVTANSSAFPREKRWNCRLFRYKWKECELLNDLQHRLNPMFFVHLLKKLAIKYT